MIDVKVLKSETAESDIGVPQINRRRALAKLGLTAAAIYVAPTLLALTPAGAGGTGASGTESGGTGASGTESGGTGASGGASAPSTVSAPSAPETEGSGEIILLDPA